MPISNQKIAQVLYEIGEYLDMQKVSFKPRAYEKAAQAVEGLAGSVEEIYREGGIKALKDIPGVGESIAEKIEELIKTGKVKYYEGLKKKTPVNLGELRGIEGLGPKSIQKLYEELGIRSLADLERAAQRGKIAGLSGFGKKTEANILKGIEFLKGSSGRAILGFAMPQINSIEEQLKKLKEVEKLTVAGSARRKKETIGDIDILVVSTKPEPIMDYFTSMAQVVRVYAKGRTKSSVRTRMGLDVDLRIVPKESYGAALNYFTGSKDHNVALRQVAIKKGYKLNEYGLFKVGRGKEKMVAGATEEEVYAALGLDYIEPELREHTGEIELAAKHALPKLIGYGEILGDLQVQTDWTDGSASIEKMVEEARRRKLQYIAITDHTKRLAMTGGLDEKRILKQMAEIDHLNKKLGGSFKILKGTECDILKDGTLDLPDEVLAKLDFVGASVHSFFHLPRAEQTERVKRAMRNPHVDMIFHPTGRILKRREACDLDLDEVVKAAKATKTLLEIDAYPDRSDLKDEYIRKAVEAGVKLAVDSDAHAPSHYEFIDYGVAQARRGWAKRKDIVNSWPVEKMLAMLK